MMLKNKKEDFLVCYWMNRAGEGFIRAGYGPSMKNKNF